MSKLTAADRFATAHAQAEQARREVEAAEAALKLAQKAAAKAAAELMEAAMEVAAENARTKEREKCEAALAKERERSAEKLAQTQAKHKEALQKEREKAREKVEAARQAAKRVRVKTETGETRDVSEVAFQVVKKALKGRSEGMLSPLDGDEAQGVLRALDEQGNVGDSFLLTVGTGPGSCRVRFKVEGEGLSFKVAR